jgi:hypothetical protein
MRRIEEWDLHTASKPISTRLVTAASHSGSLVGPKKSKSIRICH